MQQAEPFLVLFAWYAPGFVAARLMVRRGHDPLPWVYAAWIGGALSAVAALVWARATPPPATATSTESRQPVGSGSALDQRNP